MKEILLRSMIIISVLLWSCISLQAQENSVRGLLVEKSGASRVSNVSVLNKRTRIKVLSSELGLFRISATIGDTLLFSKTGYSDLIHVIPSLSDLVLRM